MTATLDDGRRDDSPWTRASRLIVRLLIGGVILIGCYITLIFAVMTPWGRSLTTPSIQTIVKRDTNVDLPGSYVQTGRRVYGGLDPSGFFTGRSTALDAAKLIATLEKSAFYSDVSAEPVTPLWLPPTWWNPSAWNTRRSFRADPPNPTVIHVDPTTGEIAIEWITT